MHRSYWNLIGLLGLALAVGMGCGDDEGGNGGDGGTGGAGATGGTGGVGGGTGGTGGTGGGTGGTGGMPAGLSNADTCCDGQAEGDPACAIPENLVDCDYGCTALGNTFGFAIILNVAPETVAADSTFTADFWGEAVVSEAFIQGAEAALMADLNKATVNMGGVFPITALSGATGDDVELTADTIPLDLDVDSDGNTVPGPFAIPVLPGSGSFTAGAAGEACFNYAAGMNFVITVNELDGGPTFIPAAFNCQPANQVDINASPAVITPEAAAGQVCIPIT